MTKRRMTNALIVLAVGLCCVGISRFAMSADDKPMSSDHEFMNKAAQGGMAEVKLGELAKQNANDDQVKRFGDMMVHDHTKANDELKELAKKKDVTLPVNLSDEDTKLYDKLAKVRGMDFDREYIKAMVDDHKTDIAEFDREAKTGTDPDVKSWAARTLPTLKDHLKNAEEIAGKLGVGPTTKPAVP